MHPQNSTRILAISDLHGQMSRFEKLLEAVQYNSARDRLVVCGDMIDRGSENIGCLTLCRKLQAEGAIILKGNHEQFFEANVREILSTPDWRLQPPVDLVLWYGYNGGETTLKEIKDLSTEDLHGLLEFVETLPCYFEKDDYIFSHAGLDPDKALWENTENDFLWSTRDFYALPAYADKIVVFGHTPTFCLPGADADRGKARIWHDRTYHDKIDIDCGAVYGGKLSCLELPSMREYYV